MIMCKKWKWKLAKWKMLFVLRASFIVLMLHSKHHLTISLSVARKHLVLV